MTTPPGNRFPLRSSFIAVLVVLAARTAAAQCPGVPTFMPVVNFAPAGGYVEEIESADIDADGDLDLVLCNGAQIVIARNNGGTFVPEPPVPAPHNIEDLAVGDFNEDGLPDVAGIGTFIGVVGGVTAIQGRIVVFLTVGTGAAITFAVPVVYPFGPQAMSGSAGRAIRIDDLNADGILDLVAVDSNSQNVWVLLGQGAVGIGNGTFGAPAPYPVASTGHSDVATGDLNGDGARDLVLVAFGGVPTGAIVLRGVLGANGLPTGTFAAPLLVPIPGNGAGSNVEVVDVNADGLLDLTIAGLSTIVVAYGAGGFSFNAIAYLSGPYPAQMAIGDFSGDGQLDIAVARNSSVGSGPGNFSVLVGNPGGGFTGYNALAVNAGLPNCIASGDFNGDGILDVAVGKSLNGVDLLYGTCLPSAVRAVNLSSPNGGEVLQSGTMTTITWTKSISVAAVDLDVSHDNGTTWAPVARTLPGVSATWFVTPPGSNRALMRVTASGYPSIGDVSNSTFFIVGPGAAAAVPIGTGCSPIGAIPSLVIGPPVLGTAVPITLGSFPGVRPGGLFVSPIPPFPSPVSPGCVVELDLSQLVQFASFTTDATGAWASVAVVPSLPALVGLAFRAQAGLVVPVAPGYALTNAIDLTLGF